MSHSRSIQKRIAKTALAVAIGAQALAFAAVPGAFAAPAAKPYVSVDGTSQQSLWAPVTKNGATYGPLAGVSAALGAAGKYDAKTNTISIKKGNRLIILQPESKTAKVNGAKSAIVAAPILVGGVPYVPLRFVAESLGASLSWNASAGAYEVNTRLHPFTKDGNTSFVNVYGESVIGATYGIASAFSGGLSVLQQGDAYGYEDRSGKIAIPVQYSSAYDFADGLALVTSKDGTQSYIDKSGQVVLSPAYDELFDFSEGLAAVRSGDSFGYIDKTGKLVIPAQYEDAFYFSGGLAAVQIDGSYGFIDKTGKLVIPAKYQSVSDFKDGLALASTLVSSEADGVEQSTGVFGYLNAKGEWAIPAQYEEGYAFSNGLAAVVKDGVLQFIDKNGKTAFEADYDDVGDFSEGLAAFEQDGKYGYINKKGEVVIEPAFDQADAYKDGLAYAIKGDWEGLINAKGAFVVKKAYAAPVEAEDAAAK